VGEEYEYKVSANCSLGDLSGRMQGGNQVSGYFDIEKPRFALEQGPAWLKIDPSTGVLSGTPEAPGKVEVVVTATIDRSRLDEKPGVKRGAVDGPRDRRHSDPDVPHRDLPLWHNPSGELILATQECNRGGHHGIGSTAVSDCYVKGGPVQRRRSARCRTLVGNA
jgi:hypothetical protein